MIPALLLNHNWKPIKRTLNWCNVVLFIECFPYIDYRLWGKSLIPVMCIMLKEIVFPTARLCEAGRQKSINNLGRNQYESDIVLR